MNEKKPSIKVNFIMNAILSMSSFIFPLITFPYVSRTILPAGYGKTQFASSVIVYFVNFALLGIPTYGVRACAKVRDDRKKLSKTVQEIFIIGFVMSIVVYIAFFLSIALVPKFRSEKVLFLIMSTSIMFYTIGVEWLFKAMEQYKYITIRSLIFKLIALGAMFLLVHTEDDYVIYGAISIFASSASNVLNFFYARHFVDIKPMGGYNFKQHLKPIFVFFAMSCATTIYVHLDSVMLGFMTTDEDVGYYNTGIKMKMILVSIVTSLGSVLLPRVSYYIKNKMYEEFERITKKALTFVIIFAMPVSLYFIVYARESVLFLSGIEYEPAIVPMMIIMGTVLLIGLTNLMGIQMLVPLEKEKYVLYSEIAGAIVDLTINALLIPKMASVGAAIGTLVAEMVVWIVQYIALRDIVKPAYKKVPILRVLAGMVIGTAGAAWVKLLNFADMKLELECFIKLAVSATLFFGLYLGTLLFTKEPLSTEIVLGTLKKFKKKKA